VKFTKGFSLLELVLAIAVFSLGSYAIATMLIDSNISTKLSIERTEALYYAKEGMEATRSIRDNTVWADFVANDYGLTDVSGSWAFGGSFDTIDSKYTRVVGVEDVSSTTKNISVTVSWPLTPARTASVVLNSLLTNWTSATSSTP
jgi:prepilin-type N-terminal cleavage/methylation domain-containing protein